MNDASNIPTREAIKEELEDIVIKSHSWDGRNIDHFLQSLVELVNATPLQLGITVTVGGATISGTLISLKTYFETFADQFVSGWEDDEAKVNMREHFARMGRDRERAEGEPEDWKNPAQYIHLKDAKVVTGQVSFPGNGGLWRGKISAVEGFFHGKID